MGSWVTPAVVDNYKILVWGYVGRQGIVVLIHTPYPHLVQSFRISRKLLTPGSMWGAPSTSEASTQPPQEKQGYFFLPVFPFVKSLLPFMLPPPSLLSPSLIKCLSDFIHNCRLNF